MFSGLTSMLLRFCGYVCGTYMFTLEKLMKTFKNWYPFAY